MSSTGIISRPGSSPLTNLGEELRHSDLNVGSMPGPQEYVKQDIAIVDNVHPEFPRLVKAHTPDGAPVAHGAWIELNHSADEIAERWGTIRTGFRIRVNIIGGMTGLSANANIIGVEGQDVQEPFTLNDAERGLFAIFTPGIGTG